MKKLIILLSFVLSFFVVNAQHHPNPHGPLDSIVITQVIQVKGITDVDINPASGDLIINYTDNTSENVGHVVGQQGPMGNQGIQGIQGIQGDPGPQGPPGTSNLACIITPEQYGAIANDGLSDQVALQNCFANAGGKTIFGSGVYNSTAQLNRNKLSNTILRGDAMIITLSNFTGAVIGCATATSETEAIQMQNYRLDIEGWTIGCQSNQVGIKPGPGSNHQLKNLIISGGVWGVYLEFCLKAHLQSVTVLSSTNGFYIGWGGFPGANKDNSQSNATQLNTCHIHTVSTTGFKIDQTYHVSMFNCLAEGNGTIQRVVHVDLSQSNTSKDFVSEIIHFEQIGGVTIALYDINILQGTATISFPIMHYQGKVINGTGNCTIELKYLDYAVGDSNGDYFSTNGPKWHFHLCNGFYSTVVPGRFSNTSTYCSSNNGGGGCGANTFTLMTR